MTRFTTEWTPELNKRLYEHVAAKRSSTEIAKALSLEFSCTLSRSAILGKLHRDKLKGLSTPRMTPRGSSLKQATSMPKKNNWRKDDEKWLEALDMRKRGHNWSFIAAWAKLTIAEVQALLRSIARADIAEGGDVWGWRHVFANEVPDSIGAYDE